MRLGISRANADSQWNPDYNAFHRFFFVETKFVGSTVNVSLTRQSYCQNVRESSIQVCAQLRYRILFATSGLAKRMRLHNNDFRLKNVFGRKISRKSAVRSYIFLRIPKLCTDLNLSLLYIFDSQNMYQIRKKYKMPALGVCLPRPCSSAGRRFAASTSRLQYYQKIVSFPRQKNR